MMKKYIPPIPNKIGIHILSEIPIETLVPYIDWRFFFMAWKLTGKYAGIAEVCDCQSCQVGWLQQYPVDEREKAKEALSLFKDTRALLKEIAEKKTLSAKAIVGHFPAYAKNEGINIKLENKELYIPTLRQQEQKQDGYYYSLSDFISPEEDYVGTFAVTIHGAEELSKTFEEANDLYNSILVKTIADRLAEAAAEWVHEKIRKEYWGYAKEETLSIEDMLKVKYLGIRPAVGYPSLPDQSIIFDLQPIIPFEKIDIKLTENGAMYPNASVCGLVISHPKSQYFNIGKIGEDQLQNYAERRGKSVDELKKWLAHNIN